MLNAKYAGQNLLSAQLAYVGRAHLEKPTPLAGTGKKGTVFKQALFPV
jgi:hypothetical protein